MSMASSAILGVIKEVDRSRLTVNIRHVGNNVMGNWVFGPNGDLVHWSKDEEMPEHKTTASSHVFVRKVVDRMSSCW